MELIYACAVLRNYAMNSCERARMLRHMYGEGGRGCGDYFNPDAALVSILAYDFEKRVRGEAFDLSDIPALRCWN
jgi:hypothetical protein